MAVLMRGSGDFDGELASAGSVAPAQIAAAVTAATARRSARLDSNAHSPCAGRRSMGPPARSIGGLRSDQLPVRIARGDLAREGPDVGDFLDALGIAGDDLAAAVARGRDQLAHELHGDVGHAVLELGLDDVRALDADEALVDLLAA